MCMRANHAHSTLQFERFLLNKGLQAWYFQQISLYTYKWNASAWYVSAMLAHYLLLPLYLALSDAIGDGAACNLAAQAFGIGRRTGCCGRTTF